MSFSVCVFQPYHGTALREYCLRKGYIPENYLAGDFHMESGLEMPQISREEISGLQRTFTLYVKMPLEYRAEIAAAERLDWAGDDKFRDLAQIYRSGTAREEKAVRG